ncbi:hypothetical protein EJ07DRAFT_154787 [Lizonia empirigonia]|nr:hypothetical protein EJ07DRAFT_154787 [Lizonia empirigonia]
MRADDNPFAEDCLPGPASDWWTEKLTRWSTATLPNLKELLLDLAFACCDHSCTDIDLAFKTLASSADIATLTLKHLPDFCLVQSPDMTQLANITKLHLLITTWSEDANPDADILSYHRHSFFNVRLNTTWLLPMQPHLTHLTIHTNTYWGVYPCWQPSTLHFPHLTSLALGKWTLAFPWQLALLTSHTTLQSLLLTNCPILHAPAHDPPPGRQRLAVPCPRPRPRRAHNYRAPAPDALRHGPRARRPRRFFPLRVCR